jgi:hypothetical protein
LGILKLKERNTASIIDKDRYRNRKARREPDIWDRFGERHHSILIGMPYPGRGETPEYRP